MIQTWIADVTPLLNEEIYYVYYRKAPHFRKEKADRLKQREGRALSIGAWTLFEEMRLHYGLSDYAVYNLSHSGTYALCSVSDRDIPGLKLGCDVEVIKDLRVKVVRRFFCEQEAARIMEMAGEEERCEAFYRCWVLKESFMKATGLGMKLDMRNFEVSFDRNDIPYLVRKPDNIEGTFFYREYQVPGVGAKVAVCSTDGSFGRIEKKDLSVIDEWKYI